MKLYFQVPHHWCSKVLVSEVGEGVSVAALLSGDKAAWKGRSEQINMLQKKVSSFFVIIFENPN